MQSFYLSSLSSAGGPQSVGPGLADTAYRFGKGKWPVQGHWKGWLET